MRCGIPNVQILWNFLEKIPTLLWIHSLSEIKQQYLVLSLFSMEKRLQYRGLH